MLSDMLSDMEGVMRDLIASINQYNSKDMLDGYMDGLAEEFNDRLDSLGLPLIGQSLIEDHTPKEVDEAIDGCYVGYDKDKDAIFVYRQDGTLASVIGGQHVGFEVCHIEDKEDIKRCMLESDGWNASDLGLLSNKRHWYAIHTIQPNDSDIESSIAVYDMTSKLLFVIVSSEIDSGIPDDLSYQDMIQLVIDNYYDPLVDLGLQYK